MVEKLGASMLLEARNVSFRYSKKTPFAFRDVNLSVGANEKVALVGPSGSGKSTLAKLLGGYLLPDEGEILWDGKPLSGHDYLPVQMIAQHPELAVNPRWKLSRTLSEGWRPDAVFRERMGIEEEWLARWPTELSAGELQRFCVARAMGPETKFLICDEISAMLDSITQAQIWRALLNHSKKKGVGLLVITHNISLAKKVCERVIELS
jgi:peptide/nickel transport system ATP-binding protein